MFNMAWFPCIALLLISGTYGEYHMGYYDGGRRYGLFSGLAHELESIFTPNEPSFGHANGRAMNYYTRPPHPVQPATPPTTATTTATTTAAPIQQTTAPWTAEQSQNALMQDDLDLGVYRELDAERPARFVDLDFNAQNHNGHVDDILYDPARAEGSGDATAVDNTIQKPQTVDETEDADLLANATAEAPTQDFMDLVDCFVSHKRELEMLAVCFAIDSDAPPSIHHFLKRENTSATCSGQYNYDTFIKQRNIHKRLETNPLNCRADAAHQNYVVGYGAFERGAVQIVQQWRLVNATRHQAPVQRIRAGNARFSALTHVHTELFGLECILLVQQNEFLVLREDGRPYAAAAEKPKLAHDDPAQPMADLYLQFRIDRFRTDGEWGFPLKSGVQRFSGAGLSCELQPGDD